MRAPQTLRPPSNWQDFESLCKHLWGEIWNCPEIKKNGRNGQNQDGVDIYGIPFFENDYYGIQCKGKIEYYGSQFSKQEVDKEIENAKGFKPLLKKLFFATTAVKDVKIEEYFRIKNTEHKKQGLFEVHLYCWEDIVELIDLNKSTHDWYVKMQNFKTNESVSITFEDGGSELLLNPKFTLPVTFYSKNAAEMDFDSIFKAVNNLKTFSFEEYETNLSYVPFKFKITNTGTSPIEEFKVLFSFSGKIQDLNHTNISKHIPTVATFLKHRNYNNTKIHSEEKCVTIIPLEKILVGDDSIFSETIFIKPIPENSIIEISWKLISKNFRDTGNLIINITPEIKKVRKFAILNESDQIEEGTLIEGEIGDFILKKKTED